MKRAKSSERPIRVFIVDDHPIVRQGLAQLIDQEPDVVVCGQAEDAPRALEAMASAQPDVALVDISLQGTSGIELIKAIRARCPRTAVLVVSMHDESLFAERTLRAGARGYIMKREPPEKVIEGIRQVMRNEICVSDRMAAAIVKKSVGGRTMPPSPIERLSDRELEVFQLIGQSLGTREIARRLHLSVKTIETYRASIKAKLDLKNATELLAHAIKWAQDGRTQ